MSQPVRDEHLAIVPANETSWDDTVAIFGTADYPYQCQCQRFKVVGWIWRDSSQDERTLLLRTQTACGVADAPATSGLLRAKQAAPSLMASSAGGC